MEDIEETVVGNAKVKRRKRATSRFRKNEKQKNTFGINQVANLGPQSESTNIDSNVVPIIHQLASRGYDNRAEFNKFLNVVKRRHKFSGRNSDLLRVYKLMVKENMLKPHVQLPVLLRTKLGKSASGILSITVFTSSLRSESSGSFLNFSKIG